jgi:hypothetical protein
MSIRDHRAMDEFGPNTDRVYAFLDELSRIEPEEAMRMAAFFDPNATRRKVAWRHVERLRKGGMRRAWEHARDAVAQWGDTVSLVNRTSLGLAAMLVENSGPSPEFTQRDAFPAAIDAMTGYVFERDLHPFEMAALLVAWHSVRPGEPRAR